MTPSEVAAFQRAHKNHLGRPLRVDGDFGPQTEWAADFETICQARRSFILAAQPFIGSLAEVPPGSNDDPEGFIRSCLLRCGAKPRDPWCAAFMCWCLSRGLAQPVRIAGAQALGKHFPATTQPFVGDLFWYPTGHEGSWTGHVGLVVGVSALEIMAFEGNCANAARCTRRPRVAAGGPRLRFARTVEDTSGTCPGIVPTVDLAPGGTR